LPYDEAYNWNQALMDLGATICTSNNPQCTRCPIQEACLAYEELAQHSLFPTGSVLRQLRKVAEKKSNYQTQPFMQSNRYFRGRVIDRLRTLDNEQRLSLAELGPVLKPDYQEEADLPWLQKLLKGLAKDGLISLTEAGVRLP
ncbi:MAG TPA: A/G-specific adenine glycosylase, partial [Ktedonobacteraceae bacterium]|nr:A/G-specific adenine glycosylase [Ktedonobacteraceae bacterium]